MAEDQARTNSEDALDRRVYELGEAYLDWLQAGGVPDREAVVASHPEIAEVLGRHLALIELLHGDRYVGDTGKDPPDSRLNGQGG